MRDLFIIGLMCLAAIFVGAALFFFGPAIGLPAHTSGPSVTVLTEGKNANTTERRNYRVTNAEELFSLWQVIYGTNPPGLPTVDFTKNEVLAVFDGSHGTGGYAVQVLSVTDSGVSRVVAIEHQAPGAGCTVTDAVTSPYQIVLVPKMRANMSLSHTDQDRTVDCQ
jgi:hypothetical protein